MSYSSPNEWGPCLWKRLHMETIIYPRCPTEYDMDRIYNLFYNLPYELPCPNCAKNLIEHYQVLPLTRKILSSRRRLIKWLIDIHNMVNSSLGKPTYSYDYAMSMILNDY